MLFDPTGAQWQLAHWDPGDRTRTCQCASSDNADRTVPWNFRYEIAGETWKPTSKKLESGAPLKWSPLVFRVNRRLPTRKVDAAAFSLLTPAEMELELNRRQEDAKIRSSTLLRQSQRFGRTEEGDSFEAEAEARLPY